ncbi:MULTISPECIES: hypothetical protein [unclassified Mesorhizobium]
MSLKKAKIAGHPVCEPQGQGTDTMQQTKMPYVFANRGIAAGL